MTHAPTTAPAAAPAETRAAPCGCEGFFRFFATPVAKKAIMAVTGLALFGFVVGHLAGNLQFFQGREKLNAYAEFLHHSTGLLWGARVGLLACLALHVVAAAQLTAMSQAARPIPYQVAGSRTEAYAARTMLVTGGLVLAYVVFHLLHFTTGNAHPKFDPNDVYANVIVGFRSVPASLVYVIAMGVLATHLRHGLWALCQSLGVQRARRLEVLATVVAGAIGLGYISIPLAVLFRVVNP